MLLSKYKKKEISMPFLANNSFIFIYIIIFLIYFESMSNMVIYIL